MLESRDLRLRRVVLTVWGEDVEDLRVLKSRGLMFYSAGNQEGIAGAGFEAALRMFKDQVAADDVDELFMRMTVARACPTFAHPVTDEHHAGVVAHDLAAKTVFR